METKESLLAFIKNETGWDDTKCLEWYNQQEEADRSANEEVCNVWYAYVYKVNDKLRFVATQTEPSSELMEQLENYECTSSEKRAKELIKAWKEPYEQEKAWDRYINR